MHLVWQSGLSLIAVMQYTVVKSQSCRTPYVQSAAEVWSKALAFAFLLWPKCCVFWPVSNVQLHFSENKGHWGEQQTPLLTQFLAYTTEEFVFIRQYYYFRPFWIDLCNADVFVAREGKGQV